MRVVIARQFRPGCLGATGDHFQPHYRMPFALMSGRRDGPFSIDLASSHCLLTLRLSAALPASYANVEGCGIQNGNASSNHTSSATQSGLQRNSARFATQYANNARISRLFPDKPDCGERTAQQRRRSLSRLFSGGHMRSPVSSRAIGECNAITSRDSATAG
jgi:hypothetical protein